MCACCNMIVLPNSDPLEVVSKSAAQGIARQHKEWAMNLTTTKSLLQSFPQMRCMA